MSSAAWTHKQTNKQLLQSTLLYTFTILSPKRWNERVVVDYADMRILTRTSFVSLLLVNFQFFLVTLSLQQAGVYCKEVWIRLKELSESFYLIFNNLFRILKQFPKSIKSAPLKWKQESIRPFYLQMCNPYPLKHV